VQLDLEAGEPVHVIERLRTANGEPMAIERAYLRASIPPGLTDESLGNRSLYALLEERYGIVLDAGEQTIQASLVQPGDDTLLVVPPGSRYFCLHAARSSPQCRSSTSSRLIARTATSCTSP